MIYLQSMKAAQMPPAAADDLDLVPADWTDDLLRRLKASGLGCGNRQTGTGDVLERVEYRSSPPVAKSEFVALAKQLGLSYEEALEYYSNYLVDVRMEQHRDRVVELFDRSEEGMDMLGLDVSDAQQKAGTQMLNDATKELSNLINYIYQPLRCEAR